MRPVEAILPQAQAQLTQVHCMKFSDGEHVTQEVDALNHVYALHLARH